MRRKKYDKNTNKNFELKLSKIKKPNKETLKAFSDVYNNIGVTSHDSAESMFEAFGVNLKDLK